MRDTLPTVQAVRTALWPMVTYSPMEVPALAVLMITTLSCKAFDGKQTGRQKERVIKEDFVDVAEQLCTHRRGV